MGTLLQGTVGQTKENLRLKLEVGSTGADTRGHQRKPGQAAAPSSTQSPALCASEVTEKATDFVLWDVGGYLATDLGAKVYKQSEDEHMQEHGQGGMMQCQLEGGSRPPTE